MSMLGYATAAATLGLQSIQVRPKRSIGPFVAQVVFEEVHTDELVITDHPVELGAMVSDHAFMLPAEVVIKCGWSNSASVTGLLAGLSNAVQQTVSGAAALFRGSSESQVRQVYQNLQQLQSSRIPFEIQTGKRLYRNMLIKSLRVTTDKENENALAVTAVCREVMLVAVSVVAVGAPPEAQANPAATQAPISKGTKSLTPAPVFNAQAGAQSFPVRLAQINGTPI